MLIRRACPIVFLHGFLGSPKDFDPLCSHLTKYSCIQMELPGHGSTPFTEDFFSLMPDFPKMHLVGYSMGGRLLMQYAAAFPEKVATITILSAHLGLKTAEEKQQRWEQDLIWAKKLRQSFDDFLIEWYDQPIFSGFIPNLKERKAHDPEQLSQTLLYYSLGKQDLLLPKEAVFIVGERDMKYRSLYKEAIVIPNAGHMVHLEGPEKLAKIIEKRCFI